MTVVDWDDMKQSRSDEWTTKKWDWYQQALTTMRTHPGEWIEFIDQKDCHAYHSDFRMMFDALQKWHNPFLTEFRYPEVGRGVVYARSRRGPRYFWKRLVKL